MSCFYCDWIHSHDPSYQARDPEFDLGKDWARCPRHWRYVCSECSEPNHFQATFYCSGTDKFICSTCSGKLKEVVEAFWGWGYYWECRCPSCGGWHPSLDYLEYVGRHPYVEKPRWERDRHALSKESSIPVSLRGQVRSGRLPDDTVTNEEIAESWDEKADAWDREYDENGDSIRKYHSDPVLFGLLGSVEGLRVLDAGSGNGYLCRLLSKRGARMVGVELSRRFYEIALRYEEKEPLGITYHNGTIGDMPYIGDESMDAVVSNWVLMDCKDYEDAVAEFWRILRPGGVALLVVSHPCFMSPVHGWVRIPPDTRRREERVGWIVDHYFAQGRYLEVWGHGKDGRFNTPFVSFHRTLSDYCRTFHRRGFVLTDLEEPSVSDLGRKELPPHQVEYSLRIPWSITFKLIKPVQPNV